MPGTPLVAVHPVLLPTPCHTLEPPPTRARRASLATSAQGTPSGPRQPLQAPQAPGRQPGFPGPRREQCGGRPSLPHSHSLRATAAEPGSTCETTCRPWTGMCPEAREPCLREHGQATSAEAPLPDRRRGASGKGRPRQGQEGFPREGRGPGPAGARGPHGRGKSARSRGAGLLAQGVGAGAGRGGTGSARSKHTWVRAACAG